MLDYARLMGWRCYFTWNSKHSPAGYPDLTMVRPPRLVFAELKSEHGRVTAEQAAWLQDLCQIANVSVMHGDPPVHDVQVFIWRPSDWAEIERELAKC